jgi:Ca2+/H+ antiporter, TMEM165/GDT1 family
MEALLPAFIAVLLAEIDGRVQHTTETLSVHFAKPTTILGALTLSSLVSLIAAGFSGALIAPLITYEARTLLLGLALLITGGSMLFPHKLAKPIGAGHAFPVSLWRYITSQFGDNSQFLVFAITARSASPTFAVVGGLAAIIAAALPPLFMPKEWRNMLPVHHFRRASTILFFLSGVYAALSGLRLI